MAKTDEIILEDDDRAAEKVTVEMWRSLDGFIYQDERTARYASATHLRCECGNITRKSWAACKKCREKSAAERHQQREKQPWDGKAMIYAEDADLYFADLDDLDRFCEDRDCEPSDLRLLICEPQYAWEVDPRDLYENLIPGGREVPCEISAAFDEMNKIVRDCKRPLCWIPGKYALDLEAQIA